MREWFLDQLAMYAAYHRDKRNEATHHLGVPMIVFSLMVLMAPVRLVEFEVGALTLAGLMIGLLLLYYVLMAPLVGIVAVLLYGALLYGAEHLAGYGTGFAVKALLCFSWSAGSSSLSAIISKAAAPRFSPTSPRFSWRPPS